MSRSDRAVFRLPLVSVVFPVLLFVCVTPLATVRPYLLPLYVIPVLALLYILITHSAADAEAITVVGPGGRHRIPWANLDGFEFHGPRWAIAVTLDGRRLRLPMVRPRDLPRLASVSGGRLTLGQAAAPQVAAAPAESDAEPGDAAGLEAEPAPGPAPP